MCTCGVCPHIGMHVCKYARTYYIVCVCMYVCITLCMHVHRLSSHPPLLAHQKEGQHAECLKRSSKFGRYIHKIWKVRTYMQQDIYIYIHTHKIYTHTSVHMRIKRRPNILKDSKGHKTIQSNIHMYILKYTHMHGDDASIIAHTL
jgi:hypothetical protein